MADSKTTLEFQFVHSTIATPAGPKDAASRALIRKQAMKRVAASRKREGNYGKHNLRQYPVFLVEKDSNKGGLDSETCPPSGEMVDGQPGGAFEIRDTKQAITEALGGRTPRNAPRAPKAKGNRQQSQPSTAMMATPLRLPAKEYELASMQLDFNILDLSTLATLHIGRTVRGALSQHPQNLIYQLRTYKRWSYLNFLPSRYGHITCLSDATNCVIARAKAIICPGNNWEMAVIRYYVKALVSLQKALDCPKQRFQPEVLCATEILAMYELLDPAGEKGWIRHTAGAAKLIQLRGPKNYKTDFEKALLMGHSVPTMTECLLNGERCYLEQPAWQRALKSVIDPNSIISDRSEIAITLIMAKSNIPGFFVDVTNVICTDQEPDPSTVQDLVRRLRQLRDRFAKWYIEYQSVLKRCPNLSPGSDDHDSHCKVFANFLSCSIVTSRLLAAVSPSEREELEDVVQGLVGRMFTLEREVKSCSEATSLFMAQTLAISRTAKATTEDWRGMDGTDSGFGAEDLDGLVDRSKWERWNRMFGRNIS